MPRTSNSIYACVIRFLLSQKHIRQTRTDRTLQDGEEPSKNQVSKTLPPSTPMRNDEDIFRPVKGISGISNIMILNIIGKKAANGNCVF